MNDNNGFCSPPRLQRSVTLAANLGGVQNLRASCLHPQTPQDQALTSHAPPTAQSSHSATQGTQLSTDFPGGNASVEGVLVDQAVDTLLSLPQVVSQVSEIQRDHNHEIQRRLQQLHKLRNDVKDSRAKCDSVLQEIQRVDRRSRLVEEDNRRTENTCQALRTELDVLVRACESLRHVLRAKTEEFEKESRRFETYTSKMECYMNRMIEFENTLPAQQMLAQVQTEVDDLKNKKSELMDSTEEFTEVSSGQREAEVKAEINNANMETEMLLKDILLKESELADLKSQEEKLKMAVSVLHKRNAAQLTRLKKQVREQQLRSRQWQEQYTQLQRAVADTRRKLDN